MSSPPSAANTPASATRRAFARADAPFKPLPDGLPARDRKFHPRALAGSTPRWWTQGCR
jgi:hypothetical protein